MQKTSRAGVGLAGWICLWSLTGLVAQDAPAPAEAPISTLRVFVDLVQVPVLVLDRRMESIRNVDPARFTVSVDSGPPAHPRHVRVEGDDPIALGFFLDTQSTQSGLMAHMANALGTLASAGLHATDHVTLFALDCRLFRALNYSVAASASLKDGTERVLSARAKAGDGCDQHGCTREVFLWDGLYRTLQELSGQGGRRVLIVVSDGTDRGSGHSWNEVRALAQGAGVAIFGLAPPEDRLVNAFGGRPPETHYQAENTFRMICELSGGILMQAGREDVAQQLERVMSLVRQRYVVEFSRPRESVPGAHDLLVKVAQGHPFVRPSGVSISIPDPAVEKDPNTIPRNTSDALELGKRRILETKPQ